jgi:tetratricopeptide (TPR) repeat protein/HEAT repeat protein
VRRRLLLSASSTLALALFFASNAHAQDFDPNGRHHHAPPSHPAPAHPNSNPTSHANPSANPTTPDAPAVSSAALVDRYTKIVLAQPGSPFPLQRLAQLYRDRDGNLTKLVAEFETRAAKADADQYGATVTLAGIYKLDGRADDAIKSYEKAIALKPTDATAILSLAHLLQDRGDVDAARTRYEAALPLQTIATDREQTLRTLMGLSLDAKDWDKAKNFHALLLKMQPTSLFVHGELARELYVRGEFERAEVEYKDLVNASAGDNRALAPALKDLGRAQAKAHKNQEALATLKRALAAAGAEAAVRAEIYETITEIYRADQNLPALIKQLENEHPGDFARLALLGALYEETGDSANAMATYQRALAINPRHIDLRLKMIRLLQSQGELDRAIAEYEGLIRAAPNNPQFVFEECDALLQRGDRARALKLVTELEARAGNDEEVLSRVADFYGRIGENDRSLRVLTRLAQIGASDPSHLVDLGDRYFQDGNESLAMQTWKRILTTITPRSRALSALGDVYLEHDKTQEALAAFREAVSLEPQNVAFKKQLASAFERVRNYRDARQLWKEVAEKAAKATPIDKLLAREARTHIVTLWGLERLLDAQVAPLTDAFHKSPPDVEAGRTLAEVELHRRNLSGAEKTLRRVIEIAPGDAESYLALERVLVQENDLPGAIAVLEKLVGVDPKRARELYQRMAEYARQTYKDDDAIKYAARAVELNPDDAEGHKRLGEMYRSQQDTEHAITEFRAAITKNDRLYEVYFELADLLLSKGDTGDADRLFRRVVRGAPDEELVARAARLSMQINLGKGTLESLEQELLPLSIGNPQKSIYRRLLVEIYGNLTFGLVQRVHNGSPEDAAAARTALARIGNRAVKPLLDALADGDAGQQRIAIDVLGYVENKNAALPLFTFAIGPADSQLRARAMMACGKLRDPSLLPKFAALLVPKETADEGAPSDMVAVAAAWGVLEMNDRRALPLLHQLAKRGTPSIRALGVLGLGRLHEKSATAEITQIARSVDAGDVARAAAAYAMGELGAVGEAATLVMLAEGGDALPREMALLALARMPHAASQEASRPSLNAMADALFAGGDSDNGHARIAAEGVARAGAAALVMTAMRSNSQNANDPSLNREALSLPTETLDVEAMLEGLVPRDFSVSDRANALVKYGDAIKRAAISALQTSGDRARAALDAFSAGEGTLTPFVDADPKDDKDPTVIAARAKAREIVEAAEPSIVLLARHPDPSIRMKAIVLLARSASDDAASAMILALEDPNENVERVALSAIGAGDASGHANIAPSAKTTRAVAKLMETHENWAMRVLAAEAMGRLGAAGAGSDVSTRLKNVATHDAYALVREAALRALASFDIKSAHALARTMAAGDPEPRVRATADAIVRQ